MYEESMKPSHSMDSETSQALLDASRMALFKSATNHQGQLMQGNSANMSASLQQIQGRPQLNTDFESERKIQIRPGKKDCHKGQQRYGRSSHKRILFDMDVILMVSGGTAPDENSCTQYLQGCEELWTKIEKLAKRVYRNHKTETDTKTAFTAIALTVPIFMNRILFVTSSSSAIQTLASTIALAADYSNAPPFLAITMCDCWRECSIGTVAVGKRRSSDDEVTLGCSSLATCSEACGL
ncbi:hypothetical protein LXL04_019778 [Taraxacum kok-saghyz]